MGRNMDIFSVTLQGMNKAQQKLDDSAAKIAQTGEEEVSSTGTPTDTVDISDAMISMITAKTAFESNAKAMAVEKEVSKTVIDLEA